MPIPFINRELSWLEFNQRVLDQAESGSLPPLERLKFVAISASNLDEFFMVRVGGLEMLRRAGKRSRDPAGLTPVQQLKLIRQRVRIMTAEQSRLVEEEIMPELADHGIRRLLMDDLKPGELDYVARVFEESLLPMLTPLRLPQAGSGHEGEGAAVVPGGQICCLCELSSSTDLFDIAPRHVLVPIPPTLPRFIPIPDTQGFQFVMVEDAVAEFAGQLFPDEVMRACGLFRMTRNADISLDDEGAHDLAKQMEDVLAERKWGVCVRLEVSRSCPRRIARYLRTVLDARPSHVYPIDGPLGLADFMSLNVLPGYRGLAIEPWAPVMPPAWHPGADIFEALSGGDLLLYHPYDSYEPVMALIEQAALDPDVTAIKQTLYRTAKHSRVISALIRAAENGKQVTVVVELKARFDEARNLDRAEELERVGVQIVYGVKGLKTHCKATVVVRREGGELRQYSHFGTGNYNEVTARLYTDVSYLTSRRAYGREATRLFNALTGGSKLTAMKHLSAAPFFMRGRLIELIEAERNLAERGEEAHIDIKVNSLQDAGMIEALYAASRAGVKVRLNVRGICCLQPGLKKISKHIEVYSIVDRYLEHARIYSFHNGGEPLLFLSSADLMERNLDRRVELLVAVSDKRCRARLAEILEGHFRDNTQSYRMEEDGTYRRLKPGKGKAGYRAQERFQRAAEKARDERAGDVEEGGFVPHLPPGQSKITSIEAN